MTKFLKICLIVFTLALATSCSLIKAGERFPVPVETNWTKESGLRVPGAVSTSCIKLANGSYRIFYPSENGIKSSISTDGLNFVPEDGFRIKAGSAGAYDVNGAKDPDVVTETGFWRMYYTAIGPDNKHRVMSATSSDGLTWTKEPGLRINYSASYDQLADVPSVVKVSANSYKMYFVYDWYGDNSIKGATSTDGLNWTIVNVTGFLTDCMDPEVVNGDNGSLIMFFAAPRYFVSNEPMDIYKATSTDGLSWTVVGRTIQPEKTEEGELVGDPDVIQLAEGSYRMYYYGMRSQNTSDILSATATEL
jgi:predicted GH43/DUF377 family glycosyl hydrolase